jgi:hypothetical protein
MSKQLGGRYAAMKFASKDRRSLVELQILGYQFPHLETEEYDSNWLIVAGNVMHQSGSWQFTNPCLLTYEAEELASWIDLVADTELPSGSCAFIEPNLEFRTLLNVDRPVLRVYFDLEARPSWATKVEEIFVEFAIDDLNLRSIAQQWRTELSAYPQRASR